jgi:integrase/recombinase XerD
MNNIILSNERIKRTYRKWLLEAKGLSVSTVDQMLRAIALYETIFQEEDYGLFNSERAILFKEKLRQKTHKGNKLSSNSIRAYLTHLKTFFEWLCTQPGYKSKISNSKLEYLRVTRKETRIAAQSNPRKYPYIDHVKQLVNSIKINTVVDMRDQALIAFTFLTGMRDAAIISLPLECIDEKNLCIYQNPKMGVETKFSKSILSKIFQFDDDLLLIVLNWIEYLKKKGFSSIDPVFPRSKLEKIENGYSFKEAEDILPEFWGSANRMRTIFKERSLAANLTYYPPHTFRHSTIFYALKMTRTGSEVKAVSQNFGHEDVATTFSIYGNYPEDQLLEVLNKMEKKVNIKPLEDDALKMISEIHKKLIENDPQ